MFRAKKEKNECRHDWKVIVDKASCVEWIKHEATNYSAGIHHTIPNNTVKTVSVLVVLCCSRCGLLDKTRLNTIEGCDGWRVG